jgi:hypothetical protein
MVIAETPKRAAKSSYAQTPSESTISASWRCRWAGFIG